MVQLLARIIRRQADKEQDPRAYLDALLTSKFDALSDNGGQIVSTTVNGKSTTLSIPSGASQADFLLAVGLALDAYDKGISRMGNSAQVIFR
jgi:hypothetical protein